MFINKGFCNTCQICGRAHGHSIPNPICTQPIWQQPCGCVCVWPCGFSTLWMCVCVCVCDPLLIVGWIRLSNGGRHGFCDMVLCVSNSQLQQCKAPLVNEIVVADSAKKGLSCIPASVGLPQATYANITYVILAWDGCPHVKAKTLVDTATLLCKIEPAMKML